MDLISGNLMGRKCASSDRGFLAKLLKVSEVFKMIGFSISIINAFVSMSIIQTHHNG
jgi:hypothetical protein